LQAKQLIGVKTTVYQLTVHLPTTFSDHIFLPEQRNVLPAFKHNNCSPVKDHTKIHTYVDIQKNSKFF